MELKTMVEAEEMTSKQLRRFARDNGWRGASVDAASKEDHVVFATTGKKPGSVSAPATPAVESAMTGTEAEAQNPLELEAAIPLADEASDVLPERATTAPADWKMEFSTYARKTDNKSKPLILQNKQAFIDLLATHRVRADKDGKLFAPATFTGTRLKENFISASGFCLDFDHGQPRIGSVLELFPGILAAYHSTHSHVWKSKARTEKGVKIPADTTYTPENHRFRVVFLLSRPVNADEHARLVMGVQSIITPELMECLDRTCFERARPHYLPSCLPGHECHAFTGHQDGDPLDVEHFLSLGDAATAAATGQTGDRPADAQLPAPMPPTSSTHEFIDTDAVVHDLVAWAARNPTFDLLAAIDRQHHRGNPKPDGKQHIECPFEDQHTDQGQDLATFAANASPEHPSFTIHCMHDHCKGRDRLDFIGAMLGKGWIRVDQLQLQAPAPAASELKRPKYTNYRADEIEFMRVKQTLEPAEFQKLLHLIHFSLASHNGTLPDDALIISRTLGISEDQWLILRAVLIKLGGLIVEGNRIFEPITRREYLIAQNVLMSKSIGGEIGGKKGQQNKRDRQAYLEG